MIRGLRRFNLFRAISLTWVFIPFQWEYLDRYGYTGQQILLLNAVFTLASVIFEIPTGVLADTIGRKKALSMGALTMVASCATFLTGGWTDSYLHLVVANVFAALSMTLVSGSDSAYLYDLMATRGATPKYPRVEMTSTAFKLLGNATGGVIGFFIARDSIEWTFAFTAILALLASAIAATLPEPATMTRRNLHQHILESLNIVRTSRIIIGMVLFSMFLFPLLRVGMYLDPIHAGVHRIPVAYLGLAFAAKDMVSALGSFGVGRLIDLVGRGAILLFLAAISAVAFLLQGIVHGPWCYGLYLLPALALGLYSPVIRIIINENVSNPERRATVLSVEGMFRRLGYAFFSPIIGWLVDSLPLGAVFVSMAFLGFAAAGIGALVMVIGNGRLKRPPVAESIAPAASPLHLIEDPAKAGLRASAGPAGIDRIAN